MGKIVPAGMDCAGLWPKFITTRRGALILTVIGIIIQPWRFVTESATFLQVLSAFGGSYSCLYFHSYQVTNMETVFVAPLTGILAVDYWLVRRRKWKIPDLYKPDGIYW
jgi:NCS1 family nucleobase:cation symporter-1